MADKMDNILIMRTDARSSSVKPRDDSSALSLKEEVKEAIKEAVVGDYPGSHRRKRLSSSSPNIPWNVEGRSHGPTWARVRYMSESDDKPKQGAERAPDDGSEEKANGDDPSAEGDEEEAEISDPMDELKADCEANRCAALKKRLEECNDRVNSCETETTETCVEEIMDFVHCIDHCVAKDLFALLK